VITALGRHLARGFGRSDKTLPTPAEILGTGHPLARTFDLTGVVRRQSAATGLVVVFSATSVSLGADWAQAPLVAAVAVQLVLAARFGRWLSRSVVSALAICSSTAATWDCRWLLVSGGACLHLGVVTRWQTLSRTWSAALSAAIACFSGPVRSTTHSLSARLRQSYWRSPPIFARRPSAFAGWLGLSGC
jgi:hypothetical protein